MESTRESIQRLLSEMDSAVQRIVAEGQTQFDWVTWFNDVEALRSHVSSQLDRCRGKFSGDSSSVGDFTSQKQIHESVQQLRSRVIGDI